MNRRAFLTGLIAAPAVIRVAPLMRIAPVPLGDLDVNRFFYGDGPAWWASSTSSAAEDALWKKIIDGCVAEIMYGVGNTGTAFDGLLSPSELPSPLS